MRYALYYSPEPGDPLLAAAEGWLGRSAFGHRVESNGPADERLVRDARRYGFHATLKAPFELSEGRREDELVEALDAFCRTQEPVEDVVLALARPSGFFALVPAAPHPELAGFAQRVVSGFEAFRAPLSEADRARRRPQSLTERQRGHLDRWGYPYVLEDFAFHMTLTGRLDDATGARVRPELEERFAPFLGVPRTLGSLALFRETGRGADFEIVASRALTPPAPPYRAAFGGFGPL